MLSLTCSPHDIKHSPEEEIKVDYVTTEPDMDIGAYTFEQVFDCPVPWPDYPYEETVTDLPSFVSRNEATNHWIINSFDDNSLEGNYTFYSHYNIEWTDEHGTQILHKRLPITIQVLSICR